MCWKKLWARCTTSTGVVCVNKCLGVQLHLVGICQHVCGDQCSKPRTPYKATCLFWGPALTHKESTCAELGCRVDLVSGAVAATQDLSMCLAITRSVLQIFAQQYSSHSVRMFIRPSCQHDVITWLKSLGKSFEHKTIITGM